MQKDHQASRFVSQHGHSWWAGFGSLLMLVLSASVMLAQTDGGTNAPANTNNGPTIKLAEDFFDFGRIAAGQIVRHDFAFTNAGNQTLVIQDITAACGCTTVGDWNRKVEPGKSGVIPIMLNTADFSGPTLKNIKLTCNDPSQPQLVLYLNADVYKLIDALPRVAAFAFGPDFQTNQTRVIWITNNMDQPVTLKAPVLTNKTFKAELNTITEGRVFQLLVSLVPPAPEGALSVPITLETSSPKMPEVTVSAYSLVQPSILLSPPRILLNSGPLKDVATLTVTVRNQSANPLQLSDPVFTGKGAEVKLTETQPGRAFALTLTLPVGFKVPANEKIEVRVKSNRASKPWLTIPVIQLDSGEETDSTGPGSSTASPANAGQGDSRTTSDPHSNSAHSASALNK